ncbi:MAG TPA: hypothetical protein V6D28_18025 [Leptolyngbyaceae cyanobacterium]
MINQPTFSRIQVVAVPALTVLLAWAVLYQARNSLKAQPFTERLEANSTTATVKPSTSAGNTGVAIAPEKTLPAQSLLNKSAIAKSSQTPTLPAVKQPVERKIATTETKTLLSKPVTQPQSAAPISTQLPLPLALAMRQAQTLQNSSIDPLISNQTSNITVSQRRRPTLGVVASAKSAPATIQTQFSPTSNEVTYTQVPTALPVAEIPPVTQPVAAMPNTQTVLETSGAAVQGREQIQFNPNREILASVQSYSQPNTEKIQPLPQSVNIPVAPPVASVQTYSQGNTENVQPLPQSVNIPVAPPVASVPTSPHHQVNNSVALPQQVNTPPTRTVVAVQNPTSVATRARTLPAIPEAPPRVAALPSLQPNKVQNAGVALPSSMGVPIQVPVAPTIAKPQPVAASNVTTGRGAAALLGRPSIEVARGNPYPGAIVNTSSPNVATANPTQVRSNSTQGVLPASATSPSSTQADTTRQTQVVSQLRNAQRQSRQEVVAQQTNSLPTPTAQSQPTPSHDIDELESKLRELSQKTDFGDVYRGSPALTIVNPAGFGADRNTVFLSATYQQRTRYGNKSDGAIGFGIGLGDARESVGVELSYTMASFGGSRDFGAGGFNAKVHRQFGEDLGVAVGWNGFLNVGGNNDFEQSLYASATKVFRTTEDINRPLSRIAVTAGVGNGQFRSESAVEKGENTINPFASVAVRIAEPVSAIAEWTGQDLAMGVSFVPIQRRNFSWTITPAVRDLVGAGDGPRFVLGTGVSFQF